VSRVGCQSIKIITTIGCRGNAFLWWLCYTSAYVAYIGGAVGEWCWLQNILGTLYWSIICCVSLRGQWGCTLISHLSQSVDGFSVCLIYCPSMLSDQQHIATLPTVSQTDAVSIFTLVSRSSTVNCTHICRGEWDVEHRTCFNITTRQVWVFSSVLSHDSDH
jgi:hypothetical protein